MDGQRISIGDGLFRTPEQTGGLTVLNGSHCKQCGRHFFPQVERCSICENKDLEPVEMGRKGKIYSYTVCHFPPPGGKYKGYIPYAVGVIALEEGIMISARLVSDGSGEFGINDKVELCLDTWKDQEGNEIVCYAYRASGQKN